MAGSQTDGTNFVVMSKNTQFSQKTYEVSDSFPYGWVNEKWKEGFHVTSLASVNKNRWTVVMSREAPYIEQCVEIDFQYPNDGIQYRWEVGFRITACAASSEQVVVILSISLGRPNNETQDPI